MSSPITQPGYRRGQRPANYGRRFPPEVLSAEETLALMAACEHPRATAARNRAIIAVMWRSGLRVKEVVSLYPKDVDRAAGALAVRHGKGDEHRLVGLDREAMAHLEHWLEVRAELGIDDGKPLFCAVLGGRRGCPMHTQQVRKFLATHRRKAGIRKRVHPHGFRHTHASELAWENTPLPLIQAQLGHKSIAYTERYLRRVAPVALLRTIAARSWPRGNGGGP